MKKALSALALVFAFGPLSAFAYSCSPSQITLNNNGLTTTSSATDNNDECDFTGHFADGVVIVSGSTNGNDGTYHNFSVSNAHLLENTADYPVWANNSDSHVSGITLSDDAGGGGGGSPAGPNYAGFVTTGGSTGFVQGAVAIIGANFSPLAVILGLVIGVPLMLWILEMLVYSLRTWGGELHGRKAIKEFEKLNRRRRDFVP